MEAVQEKHEASFYSTVRQDVVQCFLCPRNCTIKPGKRGNCHARSNHAGKLISDVYGRIAAINLDPIEKKPLYHFYPGTKILSVGTAGCNFHCVFCQNYSLSQCKHPEERGSHHFSPEELVNLAMNTNGNVGIAFTYNEPSINYEFMLDTSIMCRRVGLATIMVSNGYINEEPLKHLLKHMDAFNIDLKAFNPAFYRKYCKGRLAPVLDSLLQIADSGNHLEVTNLVIPGLNDDPLEFESMCHWIADKLGKSTVLHLSRYFPGYKLKLIPTPSDTMFKLWDIAKNHLGHVYLGNMSAGDHGDTFCPHCGQKLIARNAYSIRKKGIDETGRCVQCKTHVIKEMNHESFHSKSHI
ncbi:MAG TPA: AmmeMemoRadiSam system radical SAM enzyme [Sunxiuqinia sp.]|nr:AmmeMemoRadiSam system radical SAM enzyme [Sunxiuqinia sp.]